MLLPAQTEPSRSVESGICNQSISSFFLFGSLSRQQHSGVTQVVHEVSPFRPLGDLDFLQADDIGIERRDLLFQFVIAIFPAAKEFMGVVVARIGADNVVRKYVVGKDTQFIGFTYTQGFVKR